MGHRVLAIVSDNPKLKDHCDKIESRKQFYKKQLEELQKKADEIGQKLEQENKPDWDCIEALLRDQGKISDDVNNPALSYSPKKDTIEICEGHEDGLPEFLKELLGKNNPIH